MKMLKKISNLGQFVSVEKEIAFLEGKKKRVQKRISGLKRLLKKERV